MERRLRCVPNGAVMKQCGVIERHFLAIAKLEPGIYTIVRSFSPDGAIGLRHSTLRGAAEGRHVAPPNAKQYTVSDGCKGLGGGAHR
jgi:hypothetical protein